MVFALCHAIIVWVAYVLDDVRAPTDSDAATSQPTELSLATEGSPGRGRGGGRKGVSAQTPVKRTKEHHDKLSEGKRKNNKTTN